MARIRNTTTYSKQQGNKQAEFDVMMLMIDDGMALSSLILSSHLAD